MIALGDLVIFYRGASSGPWKVVGILSNGKVLIEAPGVCLAARREEVEPW